jgi:hypothetical protein
MSSSYDVDATNSSAVPPPARSPCPHSGGKRRIDPGDVAVDFTGTVIRRLYESDQLIEKEITLSTLSRQGRVVYFLVFSTW